MIKCLLLFVLLSSFIFAQNLKIKFTQEMDSVSIANANNYKIYGFDGDTIPVSQIKFIGHNHVELLTAKELDRNQEYAIHWNVNTLQQKQIDITTKYFNFFSMLKGLTKPTLILKEIQ